VKELLHEIKAYVIPGLVIIADFEKPFDKE
jgi:hypothetical protein